MLRPSTFYVKNVNLLVLFLVKIKNMCFYYSFVPDVFALSFLFLFLLVRYPNPFVFCLFLFGFFRGRGSVSEHAKIVKSLL